MQCELTNPCQIWANSICLGAVTCGFERNERFCGRGAVYGTEVCEGNDVAACPGLLRASDKKITLTGGGGSGERHFGRLMLGRRMNTSHIEAAFWEEEEAAPNS